MSTTHKAGNISSPISMAHFTAILVQLVLLATTLFAQSHPNSRPNSLDEIKSFREEIHTAARALTELLDSLRQQSSILCPSHSRVNVIQSNVLNSWQTEHSKGQVISGPLFDNTVATLNDWIFGIQNGTASYPPIIQIRLARTEWRDHKEHLRQLLKEAASDIRRQNISACKSENPYIAIQKLTDATTELNTEIDLSKPIRPEELSKPPSEGPITPGRPDRLWIWTDKSSTIIGGKVNIEITLGNEAGPSCIADKSYHIDPACDGCKFNALPGEMRIERGKRVTKTSISLNNKRTTLSAAAPGLKSDKVTLDGCRVVDKLTLLSNKPQSIGPADGKTPIPFTLVFQNAPNGPDDATNLRSNTILLNTQGGTVAPHKAGIALTDSIVRLRPDECRIQLDIKSATPGHAKVDAYYGVQPAKPTLEFDFTYVFKWYDFVALAFAILLGAATKDAFWGKQRIQLRLAVTGSASGAIVAFMLAYLKMIQNSPQPYPWLVLGGFAIIGSISGISAVKSIKALIEWLSGPRSS